jgi:hypothetical protein
MSTHRSRTIGGNPLRNLAIRQGKVAEPAPVHSPAPGPRPYTEEDRRRLLAPIRGAQTYGGKSWGGAFPRNSLPVSIKRSSYDGSFGHPTDRDLDSL